MNKLMKSSKSITKSVNFTVQKNADDKIIEKINNKLQFFALLLVILYDFIVFHSH